MNRDVLASRVLAHAFRDELEKIARKDWTPPVSGIQTDVGKPFSTPASKVLSAKNSAREGYSAMRAPAPSTPVSGVPVVKAPTVPLPKPAT